MSLQLYSAIDVKTFKEDRLKARYKDMQIDSILIGLYALLYYSCEHIELL